jgi:hypothetical protein
MLLASVGNARMIRSCVIIAHVPSVALSILSIIESARPGSNFYAALAAMFEIPWICLTVGLNFVLTALITIRLVLHCRSMASIKSAASMYPGVIAILVESAAPFTATGIAFAALLGKKHPAQTAVSLVWGIFVVCTSFDSLSFVNVLSSGPFTAAYYPSRGDGACVDKS